MAREINILKQITFEREQATNYRRSMKMARGKILKHAVAMTGRRGAMFNPHVKPVVFQNMAGLRETVKRNAKCPCGSGLKYKNCCKHKKQGTKPEMQTFKVPPCSNAVPEAA